MQKWEYMVIDDPTETELNKLGAQGWELVAVNGHPYYKCFLKRPKA